MLAADEVDPLGEKRSDMRTAYLIASLYHLKGISDVSMWDFYDQMQYEFSSPRKAETAVKPGQFAKLATGRK